MSSLSCPYSQLRRYCTVCQLSHVLLKLTAAWLQAKNLHTNPWLVGHFSSGREMKTKQDRCHSFGREMLTPALEAKGQEFMERT